MDAFVRRVIMNGFDHLDKKVQENILQSQYDGGLDLKTVPVGRTVRVQTANTLYTLVKLDNGEWTYQGNQKYCPEPTRVNILGSTWGGSMIKIGFIGVGMYVEFVPLEGEWSEKQRKILTSLVKNVEVA